MLKLRDLIQLAGVELTDFKIHCATGSEWSPLDAFFDDRFQEWQEHQNQRNFECEKIVSLVHLHGCEWLFAGVWNVLGSKKRRTKGRDWFQYSTEEVEGLDHLVGHAIVNFEKNFRASYLRGQRYVERLKITEIRPERMSVGDFPGFSEIRLSYSRLRVLVAQNIDTWRSALGSVSGIYVISDIVTGRLYVGSAYGEGGIWSRWSAYARTGHGGNAELRRLLRENGGEYASNFQYTILEICDLMMTKDQILARESHWKDCLLSRQFGYNEN